MRKIMGVVALGAIGALFVVPLASAGAQTPAAGQSGDCEITSMTPNPVTAFPADVTVEGTAPTGVHLVLYTQTPPATGPVVPAAEQDVTSGTFSLTAHLTAASDVSASYTYGDQNAYTAGCADPGGASVTKVDVEAASVTAQSLAFTGSSDTPSFVLIGLAALVLGAVFVIAARQRSHAS